MIAYRQIRTLAFLVLIATAPPNEAYPGNVSQAPDPIRYAAGFPAAPTGAWKPVAQMPAANLAARTIVPLSLADKQATLKRLGVTTYSLQQPAVMLTPTNPYSVDGRYFLWANEVLMYRAETAGYARFTGRVRPPSGGHEMICTVYFNYSEKGKRFLMDFRVRRSSTTGDWDWYVTKNSGSTRITQPSANEAEHVFYVLTVENATGDVAGIIASTSAGTESWDFYGVEITPLQ